jgi:3-oxoacyl-[acyl-carrier protein] reductase
MELGLKNKIAVVAAASAGLGRAIAEELASEGVALVLCARGEERLQDACDSIASAHGVDVLAVAADVSTLDGVGRVVEHALARHGHVDILVTNNGGPPAGPFEAHDVGAWDDAFRTMLQSAVELTRGLLPGMKERRWGRILNVTSLAVKQPIDGLILSNSLRAAVTGLARTLANEVGPFGITVNNILPGFTRTERLEDLADTTAASEGITKQAVYERWAGQIPARRIGEPRDLAALAAFLASERAGYITGASITVDGGWVRSLL